MPRGLDAGWPGPVGPPSQRSLSRRRRPRSAAVARRLRHGLDAGDQDLPQWSTAFATVSTPATKFRRCGPPPSPRSRRRQTRSAAVLHRLRHGFDASGSRGRRAGGDRGPRPSPRRRAAVSPLWPASQAAEISRSSAAFATVSTLAAEDRRDGRPPSPRSRRGSRDPPPSPRSPRRRPKTASLAGTPAAAAEISHSGPPPSPRSRRRQPRTAAVPRRLHRGLDASGRGPPRWPTSLAAVSTPAAEIRSGAPPPSPRSRRRQPRTAAAPPS
jgi:hypothetical protein